MDPEDELPQYDDTGERWLWEQELRADPAYGEWLTSLELKHEQELEHE